MSPFMDPERRKEFHRKYHKEIWYPLHKQERIERSKRQKLELTEWYREYKTLRCEDCGQNHPATLEFPHTDPTQKDFNVSRLIAQSTSLRRLKGEMANALCCAQTAIEFGIGMSTGNSMNSHSSYFLPLPY